jgi:hypothetical protein
MSHPSTISRRAFLQGCLVSSAAFCLAGCRRESSEDTADYYLHRKGEFLNQARSSMSSVRSVLLGRDGEGFASEVVAESLARYEKLLPDLPYIGGDQNELTSNLCQGALGMAFYQIMKARGRSVEDSGEVLYRAAEQWARTMPLSGLGSHSVDSLGAQTARERSAARSQRRMYPADWVYTYLPGGERSFDWGVDYSACGICKLYAAHGAEEFIRCLCLLDFPLSRVMDTGLQRTTTLALGGERCDFRYTMGGHIRMEWTPDFLKPKGKD